MTPDSTDTKALVERIARIPELAGPFVPISRRREIARAILPIITEHQEAARREERWQPIETAPRDGTRVWAILRADGERWPNRSFEIWHEGTTEGGFDLGWTLFPGYGGMADKHFAGWQPLPQPPLGNGEAGR